MHDERERRLAQRLRFFDRRARVQRRQRRRRRRRRSGRRRARELRCRRRRRPRVNASVAPCRSRAIVRALSSKWSNSVARPANGERPRGQRDAEAGRGGGRQDRHRDDHLDQREAAFARAARLATCGGGAARGARSFLRVGQVLPSFPTFLVEADRFALRETDAPDRERHHLRLAVLVAIRAPVAARALLRTRTPQAVARRLGRARRGAAARRPGDARRKLDDLRAHARGDRPRGGAGDRARDRPRSDGGDPRVRAAGDRRRREAAPRRDLDGHRGHRRDVPHAPRARADRRGARRAAARVRGAHRPVRRPRVHGLHAPAAGRTDDARLPPRRVRARFADRPRDARSTRASSSPRRAFAARSARRRRTRGCSTAPPRTPQRARSRRARRASSSSARDVATQTYPRKLDYLLLSTLAGLGASLSKFAFDVRILASPGFGEIAEPFGAKQVGSSAMPFKRNPVMAERIDSLARLLPGYADVAWQNAATNLLERTLDDSANRRTILPEALLCADEILVAREEDRRRAARRRAPHRREPAHVRPVRRHRSDPDGSRQARRRPPGAARGDPRERDARVRRARRRRVEPARAAARRRRAHRALGRSRRSARAARSDRPRRRRARARAPARAAHSRHRRSERRRTMRKGHEIARGKTKVLYELDGQPDVLVVQQQDGITARDGERRDVIEGKGRIAAQTTARVFRLLNLCGLPTHYLNGGEDDDDNEMLVRRAQMIPLEVVVRGVAAGSFVKRRPGIQRGALLVPRLIEFFLKDDANHDPQIDPDAIVAQRHRDAAGSRDDARARAHHVRDPRARVAPPRRAAGRPEDRVRPHRERRGQGPARHRRRDRQRFVARVAAGPRRADARQAALPQPRRSSRRPTSTRPRELRAGRRDRRHVPADASRHGGADRRRAGARRRRRTTLGARCGAYGLPTVRHVVSVARTPGYVLQLLAQLEATFARMVVVAIGPATSALRRRARQRDGQPGAVRRRRRTRAPDEIALQCAKAFALEDTVVFGRILLMQANARARCSPPTPS